MEQIDWWNALAGLGIFLLAMKQLESSVREIGGSTFKKYLIEGTSSTLLSILSGLFVTMLLQSSSLVSLFVLAFIGGRLIPLSSGLGIIIGANLGTTLTGWVVALVGFKLSVEAYIIPVLAIGSLLAVVGKEGSLYERNGRLIFSLGFLLLGLTWMKSGFEVAMIGFDISQLADLSSASYFGAGLLISILLQSSSATMMINLTALNSELYGLNGALLLAIGADLGTTVTSILASLTGHRDKRLLALGHLVFNAFTAIIGIVFLSQIVWVIQLAIQDFLFVTVAFHSLLNLIGVIIAAPFLKAFSRKLQSIFRGERGSDLDKISNIGFFEPAFSILLKESNGFLDRVLSFNIRLIKDRGGTDESYQLLKQEENRLIEAASTIREWNNNRKDSTSDLAELSICWRSAVLSAKALMDIEHHFDEFEEISIKGELLSNQILEWCEPLYYDLNQLHNIEGVDFAALRKSNRSDYFQLLELLHQRKLPDTLFKPNALNFISEIYESNKNIIKALNTFHVIYSKTHFRSQKHLDKQKTIQVSPSHKKINAL